MNDELPDWLQQLAELTPAELAEGDQQLALARRLAADLLSSYFKFCLAMEQGNHGLAVMCNLKFSVAASELDMETAQVVMMFLCDLISEEVKARFGSFAEAFKFVAEHPGTLFLSATSTEERDLLQHLEQSFKERSSD